MVASVLGDKREALEETCERYGVERLDLFGSALGGAFVVTFAPRSPARLFDRYFGLKEDLEKLFGREVDLVMEGAVARNPHFARSVNESRVTVYAA